MSYSIVTDITVALVFTGEPANDLSRAGEVVFDEKENRYILLLNNNYGIERALDLIRYGE